MKHCFHLIFLILFCFQLAGCAVEANLIGNSETAASNSFESKLSTLSVGPSQEAYGVDESGNYKVRSEVGEMTSGVSTSEDNVYRAELSIIYQRM